MGEAILLFNLLDVALSLPWLPSSLDEPELQPSNETKPLTLYRALSLW